MGRPKIKTAEQKATRLARRIVPEVQAARRDFSVVDVANHTDGDQRHMVRSNERQTIRRKSKIDQLREAGTITFDDARICNWYLDRHSEAYDTLGITANLGGVGGGGGTSFDHMSRTIAQAQARLDFQFAREAICPLLLPLFEKVVLHGRPMGKLKLSFRRAVQMVRERVDHLIPLV